VATKQLINRTKSALLNLLPKGAFARGVSVLVGGTAAAQILLILAAPLLTRLYTPEDFGLLAVYSSLLALIGVIASLRYEQAIPLPEDDVEAANVTILSLLCTVTNAALVAVSIYFLGATIARALGVDGLAKYLWLLPVGIVLSGAYTVFNYWAIRKKQFAIIAETNIRQALSTIVIQIAAYKIGGLALLLGQVTGQSVGTRSLAKSALSMQAFRQISWGGMRHALVRYQHFPIYGSWAGLVNTAGHQLPLIMFAAFFGAAAAGAYALANRVLLLPANMIGSAIGNVFLSHAPSAKREGNLKEHFVKLQDRLIQVGLPPAVFLIVIAPQLFDIFFGREWRIAGEFAQFLVFGVFFAFVVSPLSTIFAVLEKQRLGLYLQLFLFGARLSAIFVGVWLSDLMIGVMCFSIGSVIGYLAYVVALSSLTNSGLLNFASSFVVNLMYSAGIVLPMVISGVSLNAQSSASNYFAFIVSAALLTVRLYSVAKAQDNRISMLRIKNE
jgi:O-antigen/teichoic acid export membrane protein